MILPMILPFISIANDFTNDFNDIDQGGMSLIHLGNEWFIHFNQL